MPHIKKNYILKHAIIYMMGMVEELERAQLGVVLADLDDIVLVTDSGDGAADCWRWFKCM